MAILRSKQIRGMSLENLDSKLAELKLEMMKETGGIKMGKPIKNTGKIRGLKRSIARILTVKNEIRMKRSEVKKK